MNTTILFFVVLIAFVFLCKVKTNLIKEYFNNYIYISWFIMSISIFGYQPSIIQYALRLCGILVSFVAIQLTFNKLILIKKGAMGILIAYTLFCFISTIWSVDILQTFIKSCEVMILIMLISANIIQEGIEIALKKMLYILFIMAVVVEVYILLGIVFMNSSFITYSKGLLSMQLSGGIVSSNTVGSISVFIICCLLNMRKFKFKYLIMIMAILELFLCQARTSMVSILIIVSIYFFRTKYKIFYLAIFVLLCVLVYYNWEIVYAYFLRGTDENNMTTMSGRTTMWEAAKIFVAERPLFGYGFGSGGEQVSLLNNGMSSLHSGIYECLIGVGYIGFAFVLVLYIYAIVKIILNILKFGLKNNILEIMLMIDLTIRTYMSLGIGGWHSLAMMIWFILVASFSLSKNKTLSMIVSDKTNEI